MWLEAHQGLWHMRRASSGCRGSDRIYHLGRLRQADSEGRMFWLLALACLVCMVACLVRPDALAECYLYG